MATVLDAGADLVVRAGWRNARWLNAAGEPVDLLAEFHAAAATGLIDRPIWLARQSGAPLSLRLVAVRKTAQAAAAARRKARQAARKGGHQISKGTLAAAEWMILITSLKPEDFPTADVFTLYRLRWRIELAFKRLKSSGRLEGTAGQRRAFRQTLRPGSSLDDPVARTARRRVRGLSPLGCRRLTRPAAWRLLRQLVATLRQAIIPEPTIACLQLCPTTLQRHLREPPRRRSYQKLSRIF